MSQNGRPLPARSPFRKLALVTAIVCFLFAAAFGLGAFGVEDRTFGAGISLFVGYVMLIIGKTGALPTPSKNR